MCVTFSGSQHWRYCHEKGNIRHLEISRAPASCCRQDAGWRSLVISTCSLHCSVLSQDYDGFGGLNNWSNYTDRRVRWRWIKQIILHLSCCNLYLKIHYLSWAREPQGCLCHHPRRHHHEGRWGLLTEIFWQDNLQLLTAGTAATEIFTIRNISTQWWVLVQEESEQKPRYP